MKSLVIFDSNFGNTKIIAEALAKELHGISKHVKSATIKDIEACNLLIVGSPINGWTATEATRKFLTNLEHASLKSKYVTSFDTRMQVFFHGDAMTKIKNKLVSLEGQLISPPISFFVNGKEGPLLDGELAKAKTWASKIKQELEK